MNTLCFSWSAECRAEDPQNFSRKVIQTFSFHRFIVNIFYLSVRRFVIEGKSTNNTHLFVSEYFSLSYFNLFVVLPTSSSSFGATVE